LLELSLSDLLALRQTSQSLKTLVDEECAPAIVRHYAKRLPPLFTRLYPTPAPGEASFQWILEMAHRFNVAHHVSLLIARFFWNKILEIGPFKRRRLGYRMVFTQMVANLLPLFFTLGHFFETYRRMILERAMKHCKIGHAFTVSTGGGTLWDDQLSILENYDQKLMLDCYHIYGYLLHVLEQQLQPPRFERILGVIKRIKAEPASTGEVEILLMLGGLEQVRHVLEMRSWSSRRGVLNKFIQNLKPIPGSNWVRTWQDLHVESDLIPLDRVRHLRLTLPALHLVWVPSVLKLLVASKSIDRIDFGHHHVHGGGRHVQTPIDFLGGLLKNGPNDGSENHDDEDDSLYQESYGLPSDSEEEEDEEDEDEDDAYYDYRTWRTAHAL
jgi:hypothetical protein